MAQLLLPMPDGKISGAALTMNPRRVWEEILMRRVLRLVVLVAPMLLLLVPVAHATPFLAHLDGPSEFPPNASPGTGIAFVEFDIIAHTLHVVASFSDLIGTTTAAHIHCCISPDDAVPIAGVATTVPSFPGFPLGVTSGVFDATFDTTLASTYRAGFIAANGGTVASAEAALFAGMVAGHAYFNIHTTFAPGGEIRGFLAVPAPGTLAFLVAGLMGVGAALRMRRR